MKIVGGQRKTPSLEETGSHHGNEDELLLCIICAVALVPVLAAYSVSYHPILRRAYRGRSHSPMASSRCEKWLTHTHSTVMRIATTGQGLVRTRFVMIVSLVLEQAATGLARRIITRMAPDEGPSWTFQQQRW